MMTNIKQLPIEVKNAFLRGDSWQKDDFSTDGTNLYIFSEFSGNYEVIARHDNNGGFERRYNNEPAYRQHPPINHGKEFLTALAITLPCIGLFFYVLFAQFGGY